MLGIKFYSRFLTFITIVSFFLLVLVSCKTTQAASKLELPYRDPDKSYILFAFFRVMQESENIKYELFNHIITEGYLKSYPPPPSGPSLKIEIRDIDNRTLTSTHIAHPLLKNIEYVDNDGQLQRKNIEITEAEFTVRLKLPRESYKLMIYDDTTQSQENTYEILL